jgi:hypothetical protein
MNGLEICSRSSSQQAYLKELSVLLNSESCSCVDASSLTVSYTRRLAYLTHLNLNMLPFALLTAGC